MSRQLGALQCTIINEAAYHMYMNSVEHGFHEGDVNVGEKIALIHSELSEALEYARKDITAPDKHVPDQPGFVVELADAVIRIFDLAEKLGLDIGAAIVAKHNYNVGRPYKHGKKF